MRVALFAETFLPKLDGVAHMLCRLLDHLAARGHASLMFAPRGAPPYYAQTRIVGLPSFRMPLYPELRLAPVGLGLARQLEAFRPDLVHLVNPALMGLTGLALARRRRLPVVASYHTDLPGYASHYGMAGLQSSLWAYFRWLHNHADVNLCPSDYTRRELMTQGFGRVRVWPHGVDASRFSPSHAAAAWRYRLSGGQPERPLLLYVGRLAVEKRIDWLAPVLAACPDARLAIVGDGPERTRLEELFAQTATVFTGYLTGQDLSSAYASADLFVFPSESETFGLVVLEAMASGLAVIAPDTGGHVDMVRDGVNGLLFPSQCQAGLIERVKRLLEQQSLRLKLADNALQYARSQSWEAVMDGLLVDYASALAHSARRLPPARAKRGQDLNSPK